jgi:hypothetical protein
LLGVLITGDGTSSFADAVKTWRDDAKADARWAESTEALAAYAQAGLELACGPNDGTITCNTTDPVVLTPHTSSSCACDQTGCM